MKLKRIPLLLLFFILTTVSHSSDFLMREFGEYEFSGEGYSVRVELVNGEHDGLAPTIIFNENGNLAVTGIGKGSYLPIIPKKWAAEFRPPHELWIYYGEKNLQLYERTTNPRGFKISSSTLVPKLFSRAPEALTRLMETGKAETKPN